MPTTTLAVSVTRANRRWVRTPSAGFNNQTGYLVLALFVLSAFWVICCVILLSKTVYGQEVFESNNGTQSFLRGRDGIGPRAVTKEFHIGDSVSTSRSQPSNHLKIRNSPMAISHAHLLSRQKKSTETNSIDVENTRKVTITTDVRGNLGPPEVMIQDSPGKDWIHDRWQAASNMHGTAIPGSHWVQLEFSEPIIINKVILDWEAAHADDYVLYGSMDPITIGNDKKSLTTDQINNQQVQTLFDGTIPQQRKSSLSVEETGQSPGVKTKTPLHVIHTISIQSTSDIMQLQSERDDKGRWIKYLKVWIQRPGKHGWGVSLWQIDVYGLYESEIGSANS